MKDGHFRKEFQVSEAATTDGTSGYSSLTGDRKREVARWTNVGGPIPTGGRPIYSISEVPISRINNQGVVKSIRRIVYSQTNPDAEGNDKLHDEEFKVINSLVGNSSSTSPTNPPANKFHGKVILSTTRNSQPVLSILPSSVPPPSPHPSTARPSLSQAITSPHPPTIKACGQHQ
ncbi:hypothetical protein O181_019552 [Austropuccinia psidii MF-1]|uniref:Uncharacterized protein n=1 Tax=Austropuccinia psidii MF-1 TaxID=1389203 RepID=A0A9Q3CBS5_9BASI|nr:hypothetical protein [Austropuccinia psidii MF-1]